MEAAGVGITDQIDFDDLTTPRLTDVQRQILEYTESRHVEFDIDKMLAEARNRAGASDLDDTGGFTGRLQAHVAAIDNDEGLRQLSRSTLRQRVVRVVGHPVWLYHQKKRFTEIENKTKD